MPSSLLHSGEIAAALDEYLSEVGVFLRESSAEFRGNEQFKFIFRTAFASHAFMEGLNRDGNAKRLAQAMYLVRLTPFAVLMRQYSLGYVLLRQLVESVFSLIFFWDHPVELKAFLATPDSNTANEPGKPIHYLAHRELSFYVNYASERFESDPSGLAKDAVSALSGVIKEFNRHTHFRYSVAQSDQFRSLELENPKSLPVFASLYRATMSKVAIILAAALKEHFDSLSPIQRAHFDWLVTSGLAKRIRSQQFGLCDG